MNTKQKQTALVTGASSGIGQAIAEQFARDGINLVVVARNESALQRLASQWQAKWSVQVTVIPMDLSLPSAAQALHDKVAQLGIQIDYLVNNAGYGDYGQFADTSLDKNLAMMRLNMEALTVLCHRFLPMLTKRQGKILNVASTAAFQPGPYMAVYYATKAFVLSLSEALAAELAAKGVTVTALCPGPTASGFQDKADMHDSALVKGRRLPTAEAVGQAGYAAMQRGQRVYIPGIMNWLMAQSVRFTPRRMVTSMVQLMSRPA